MFKNRLLRLGSDSKGWIILTSAMQFLNGATYILQIFIIAGFIESIYSGSFEADKVLWFFLILAGVLIVKAAASKLESTFSCRISLGVKYSIRKKIFKKIKILGPGYVNKSGTAEIITNSIDGVEAMENFFGRFLPQLIYSFIIPFILFAFTLPIFPVCAWVLLAAVPIIPISMVFISKWAAKSMTGYWNDYERLSSEFLENLQGIITLKLFDRTEKKLNNMKSRAWKFRNSTMELLRMQLTSITVMDTLVYGFAGVGIFLAIYGFNGGRVGIKGFIILLMLSVEFFLPIRKLGSYFHAGVNGIQAGKKIADFLESEEPVKELKQGRVPESSEIEFDNVVFSYGQKLPDILSGAAFRFSQGGVFGITGNSGCGKSTLGRMILRFHDPVSGEIRFGGLSLKQIPLKVLRERITLVDTRSWIFNGTIKDNLKMVRHEAGTGEMLDACRRAGLESLVKDSQDLLKQTGEDSSMLSSGERQRLAIARAILLDPDVFIFDEAAGSVDSVNEDIIKKTIYGLPADKTVFIISHRESMLDGVDDILTIRDGKICHTEKSKSLESMESVDE